MIKVKNLSKSFEIIDDNKKKVNLNVLNNLNIDIKKNSIFGIVGLSGAGKTTLLRILTGLEKPSEGTVLIEDTDIFKLSKKDLRTFRKRFGVVFQGYNLLMQENIFNNIALPLKINKVDKDIIKKRVKELLSLVNLSNKENAYPVTLSGGEQQRVAIARGIITNPDILILDEPTSALDPYTTKQIISLLKEINEELKITIIIITHEMSVVKKLCTEVAVLDKGNVVECGNVKDIINNPKTTLGKLLFEKEDYHD